jgi:transposase
MLTMYKQITIQTLHKQGLKQSEISRTLGCHRNTIRKVLQRNDIIEKQTRVKPSVFDKCKEQIKKWQDQKVTKLRIHEKLQEEYGIHSTYVNLCIYMNKHFLAPVEAFGVQQTLPGEDGEIDFGYLGMLPGVSGKLTKTYGLVVVLAYSRVAYYALTYDQKLETLQRELKNAFEYFGGVPKRLKVDNMKTAILKNQHYELDFNQDFLEFANHYGTVVVPCTPYSPEQKGKVESAIKYLQLNFVGGRQFEDDRDAGLKLWDWMVNTANKRVHGTTKKVPWVEFTQYEQAKLQPLPNEEFALFQRSVRKVAINCHIHFDNSYYSAPMALVKKDVTVRWNDNLIRILYQGEQVALHKRSSKAGTYVTERLHLPEYKNYSETEHQARLETKMKGIGQNAHEYFHMLVVNKTGYWFRAVRIILGLSEEYGTTAVDLTLKRCLHYSVTDIPTIKRILKQKLYNEELEPRLLQNHGQSSVFCRDLSYYTL